MRKTVYCLYDNVAMKYLPVFEASNLKDAIRMLKPSFFGEKALPVEDFSLIMLCDINIVDSVDPGGKPEIVCKPVDLGKREIDLLPVMEGGDE